MREMTYKKDATSHEQFRSAKRNFPATLEKELRLG